MTVQGEQLRQAHSHALMRLVIHDGPITRVELAERAGLSKQTVSEIVRELEQAGWVRPCGKRTGAAGRSPVRYEFDPHSGFVVGIDLGATTLEAGIIDLAGNLLAQTSAPIDRRGGRRLVDELEQAARGLADQAAVPWRAVQAIALGTPGIVDPESGVILAATNVAGFGDLRMRDELQRRLEVPTLLDNEVNMSAFGEQWQGHGQGRRNFVLLNVGTGVGMGVVLDGEVRRGSRGGAGELAFLPIGGDPFDRASQSRGVFESATGSAALLRRYADAGGVAASIPELFDAVARGDRMAVDALDEQARLLALGVSAVCSVLDPELVVLGGGIGSRPELLEPVRQWLARLMPTPTPVYTSALGNRAALVGALAAALSTAHQALFSNPITKGSLPIPQPGELLLAANDR